MKIAGITLPSVGISKDDIAKPKTLALGGLAATGVIGGGIVGKLRGHTGLGLGIGAAIAAVALGAALVGNASSSSRDGYCDNYGDPDCDYPYVDPPVYNPPYRDPYPYPRNDYPRNDYPRNDYPRDDYPGSYPGSGSGTSPGDS